MEIKVSAGTGECYSVFVNDKLIVDGLADSPESAADYNETIKAARVNKYFRNYVGGAINNLARAERMPHEGLTPAQKREAFIMGLTDGMLGKDCPTGKPQDKAVESLDESMPYRLGHSDGRALRDGMEITKRLDAAQ